MSTEIVRPSPSAPAAESLAFAADALYRCGVLPDRAAAILADAVCCSAIAALAAEQQRLEREAEAARLRAETADYRERVTVAIARACEPLLGTEAEAGVLWLAHRGQARIAGVGHTPAEALRDSFDWLFLELERGWETFTRDLWRDGPRDPELLVREGMDGLELAPVRAEPRVLRVLVADACSERDACRLFGGVE